MTFDTRHPVEVVGRFETREAFAAAVKALRDSGFRRQDLSVLDTHESLRAAGDAGEAWRDTLSGMVGDVDYVGPITAAGLIAIAAGPVGALVASVIAAGVTGVALRDLLEKVQATPHTENFAKALENGAVLLWVNAAQASQQQAAEAILRQHGARDVHRHQRKQLPVD